jgi:uncharacterized membrane-anchored protein
MIAAWFAKPAVKYGAIGLVVVALIAGTLLAVNRIYGKGETAGASSVTNAVQTETIKKLDAARKSKERTDEEVRRTPYDDRVDGLR